MWVSAAQPLYEWKFLCLNVMVSAPSSPFLTSEYLMTISKSSLHVDKKRENLEHLMFLKQKMIREEKGDLAGTPILDIEMEISFFLMLKLKVQCLTSHK